MSGVQPGEVVVYKPSRGLQTVLSVTFFLILLFMVNAIAGCLWLATHNLHTDSVIFFLMFIISSILLLYAGIFLFAASHSEAHIGPDRALLVLPNWRGPTPFFPYTEVEVAYKDLSGVETRGEIYRYLVLPVIVQSSCLVLKNGKRVTLGYVRETPDDPSMPFHTIAEMIAERAGVPLVHRGVVEGNAGLRALIQDEPGWDAPQLAPDRLDELRRMEKTGWRTMIILLGLVAVAAILFQTSRLFLLG